MFHSVSLDPGLQLNLAKLSWKLDKMLGGNSSSKRKVNNTASCHEAFGSDGQALPFKLNAVLSF